MKRLMLLAAVTTTLLSSCSKRTLDFMIKEEADRVAPTEIELSNQSAGYDSYQWHLGDGTIATDSSLSHRYYLSGKYMITLEGRRKNKSKTISKEVVISPPARCLVFIHTDLGDMLVELYDDTPQHRDNFIKLAEGGFYDSLIFHRVIDGFMIQGGDPQSRISSAGQRLGSGGPGYQIDAEFDPKHAHVKGALAAARRGGPTNPEKRSSGSQFYIVDGQEVTDSDLDKVESAQGFEYNEETRAAYKAHGGTPFLDQDYTVFGRVIEGIEVIDRIAKTRTNRMDRPLEDIRMYISVIK